MRSTLFVGSAAAALLLASAAAAQTSPAPTATNPATGPATPAQPTTGAPPYRGASTATPTAPSGQARLEQGAKLVSSTGAETGEVLSVDRGQDGTVTVDVQTSAGAKTMPVSAFGSRNGALATSWTDAQIADAPAGKPRNPNAATPAVPATPAQPGVSPATPAIPATPSTEADEDDTEDQATPPARPKPDRAADKPSRVGKPKS